MGNVAIFIKDKEAMVQKIAFLSTLKNTLKEPRILADIAHLVITKKQIYNALITQSTQKALGLDKTNFGILHMIWN